MVSSFSVCKLLDQPSVKPLASAALPPQSSAAARRLRRQRKRHQPGHQALASTLPPMDYAEEQENELMMLESMYMEDFVKLVRHRAA